MKMSDSRPFKDPYLLVILTIAALFCVHGIDWGSVESWHPDQMAFRSLFVSGEVPLNPAWFHKPPLFTYVNFFLSVAPVTTFGLIFGIPEHDTLPLMLLLSRAITSLMFLGIIVVSYKIAVCSFGRSTALTIAALLASSAGFVAYSHFLTTEIPVTFVMLLAFYWMIRGSESGALRDFLLAGVFTGLATATKYNALAVGVGIPIAVAIAVERHGCSSGDPWWKWIKKWAFDRRHVLGVCCVVIAFVAANPFSVLDPGKFYDDFVYNLRVTPIYEGRVSGVGYLRFVYSFVEILGWPT